MKNIELLKPFRRLWNSEKNEFELRLSYSCFRYWVNNEIDSLFQYLTGQEMWASEKMVAGRDVHEHLEVFGLPEGLQKHLDFWSENSIIVDYKFGKLDGYQKQLENYAWMLMNATNQLPRKRETKLEVQREGYAVTGLIDYLHVNENKPFIGMLVKVMPDYDENKNILNVYAVQIKTYQFELPKIKEWEFIYAEMYDSIVQKLKNGEFYEFLDINGLIE